MLPFCQIRLIAEKPKDSRYPSHLNTVGDHLRKRRIDLALHQTNVAQLLGVDEATIHNWETNRTAPGFRHIPSLYGFLGYCPIQPAKDMALLSQKIKAWREGLGLSQEEMAKAAGVDESSLSDWEAGRAKPMRRSREKLGEFFQRKQAVD